MATITHQLPASLREAGSFRFYTTLYINTALSPRV